MTSKSLRFESFTLDLERLCLRGPSGQVDLRPKSFEVLRYLVEHAGRVGGKEEIIKAVWPDVIVTEESLTRCICEVRRAIGDESQKIIKTVPKRGYLLDVSIVLDDVQEDQPPAPRATGPSASTLNDPAKVSSVLPTTTGPSPTDAERRQVTVLFCDLVGSTALASRLDAKDLRDGIRAYHKCCEDIVGEYDGSIAQYLCDGVMARFGYPKAHEDDADRAVRCGLDMIKAVGALTVATETKLEVRAGIATGVVVVGEQSAPEIGETPYLAARLHGLAKPDSIVIADSTRKLIGTLFEYHDMGFVTVKGYDDPVHAWQVLALSQVESRFEALRSHELTPLVGREEELELLLRRWREAKEGEGRVVLLSGEPGIGKSRLVAAF